MVGERGLRFSARSALRAVADATLSRYARLKPPSKVLILFHYRRKKTCFFQSRFLKYGRRERIRTSDPLVPNQLRYQAALLADGGEYYCRAFRASIPFPENPPDRLESKQRLKKQRWLNKFQAQIIAASRWLLSPAPGTSYSRL